MNMTNLTKEECVAKYSNMVYHIARKLSYKDSFLFEDLVSEGFYYLLKALERYDSSQGTKFITFAYSYVLNGMQNYLAKNTVSLSLSRKVLYSRRDIKEMYDQNYSCEEISKALDIPQKYLSPFLNVLDGVLSIDVNYDGVEFDVPYEEDFSLVEIEDMLQKSLSEKEYDVVKSILINKERVKDYCKRNNLSRSCVHKWLAKAKKKIKERMGC